MRIVVDYDLCESNAICMGIAPEVFEVRDDDFLYLLTETPGEELREKIEESVRRCPKQAITIAEDVILVFCLDCLELAVGERQRLALRDLEVGLVEQRGRAERDLPAGPVHVGFGEPVQFRVEGFEERLLGRPATRFRRRDEGADGRIGAGGLHDGEAMLPPPRQRPCRVLRPVSDLSSDGRYRPSLPV